MSLPPPPAQAPPGRPAQPAARRRRRWPWVAALVTVVVALGVTMAVVLSGSHTSGSSVSELKAMLDALPLPAGTTRTSEKVTPASDAPASVTRLYDLPTSPDISRSLVDGLRAAHYRPVSTYGGRDDPTQWQHVTAPDSGRLTVLPQGHTGRSGIDLRWSDGTLYVLVDSTAL